MNPALLGYGSRPSIGCGDLTPLLDNLDVLLRQAESLNLTDQGAYIRGRSYYDDNSSFWNPNLILIGDACIAKINEGNSIVTALGKAIAAAGKAPNAPTDPIAPPPQDNNIFDGLSSALKWIVGGAIAISVAVVAATVVPRVLGKKKSYSGYGRRRRRRS